MLTGLQCFNIKNASVIVNGHVATPEPEQQHNIKLNLLKINWPLKMNKTLMC